MKLIIAITLSLLSLPGLAHSQSTSDWRQQLKSGATLGTVRRVFLNQKVIITGPVVDLGGKVLLFWELARQVAGGRYADTTGIYNNLSSAYKGKTATALAVQLNELRLRELRPNALGEIVSEDDIVDPYFDIVVQFEDGTLAMCTGYPRSISDLIDLASAASALTERMNKELPLLVGKTVYAVGSSKLYQADTPLEEMAGIGSSRRSLKQLWPGDEPVFQPITVLVAKYLDSTGVVFKLRLPNGREALAFTAPNYYLDSHPSTPFLDSVLGTLLLEIPSKLTPKEIDAIKKGTIFKGMTRYALECAVGFRDKENDWGGGGKQLVYRDGVLVVYLDTDSRVVDWQSFDKK